MNFHLSWNPFTPVPEALPDHVCTSLWVSTGDWGLLICQCLTWRPGQANRKHVFVNAAWFCIKKQAQFVQKGFLSSQRCSVTQLCVTSCTYVQWLNWDGATAATAWELNREAKQAWWELTSTTQGRNYVFFIRLAINRDTLYNVYIIIWHWTWLNSDGATAWELNIEAKQAWWELTSAPRGKIYQIANIWL